MLRKFVAEQDFAGKRRKDITIPSGFISWVNAGVDMKSMALKNFLLIPLIGGFVGAKHKPQSRTAHRRSPAEAGSRISNLQGVREEAFQ